MNIYFMSFKLGTFFKLLLVKETGSELGPIDWFKKFHTLKDEETWATEKAKELWV